MPTTDNNSTLSNLVQDVEMLKKSKQNVIPAGGSSMILTKGSADGELNALYRKDAIDATHPDILNIPSETAVVSYVDGQRNGILRQAKKIAESVVDPVKKDLTDETLRASTAEAELKAMINGINIDSVKQSISNEVARATGAETDLRQKINDETTRAAKAETDLSASLHTEISRASSAEGELSHAIQDEVTRAKAAEAALEEKDAKLVTKLNELKGALDAETNRATNAEKALDTKVNSAVETLRHSDDQLLTTLNTEITRASGAEASLDTKIKAEIDRAKSEEQRIERIVSGIDYDEKIQALKEHVLVHEGVVDKRVDDEVDRATGVELEIRNALQQEVLRSTNTDDSLNTTIADLDQRLHAEITRSLSRDDMLEGKISAEVERATKVEHEIYIEVGNLGDRINDHDTEYDKKLDKVQQAVDAMAGNDAALDKKINDEITRASAAESAISSTLNAETVRAKDAEEKLNDNLVEEIARSTAEDQKVYEHIDAETLRAKEVETRLNDEIANERARAIEEETKIASVINSIGSDKVDKNVAGENGMIVNTLDVTLEDSPSGDQGSKQVILNKRMISLATGQTSDSQEKYDLAVLSGAHAIGEDVKAMKEKLQQTVDYVNNHAVDVESFRSSGYQVVTSQELHTEPDAYGSPLWIRNTVRDLQNQSDITKEVHFTTSSNVHINVTDLDENDKLVHIAVDTPTKEDIADMISSIFGV